MHFISFTFELSEHRHSAVIAAVRELASFWEELDFHASLFRDSSRSSRYTLTFLTEKSIEELTAMIQTEAPVRELFESIKGEGSRLVVSVMEQVL